MKHIVPKNVTMAAHIQKSVGRKTKINNISSIVNNYSTTSEI